MSYTIQRPKRISSESVAKDQQDAVDLIGSTVNNFMEEVYTATMGQMGVEKNLNMEFKTIKIKVNASGIPITEATFKTGLKTKSMGLTVIRCFISIPTFQPFITYTESQGLITINHVSGLVANTEYQLILLNIGS